MDAITEQLLVHVMICKQAPERAVLSHSPSGSATLQHLLLLAAADCWTGKADQTPSHFGTNY